MPNWCENSFIFHGDEKQVIEMYLDITIAASAEPNFPECKTSWGQNWIGNIFLGKHYSEEDVLNKINCRGGILDLSLEDTKYGPAVRLDTETAWGPNDDAMAMLLHDHYPDLDMVYRAEEPGCEVYVNTDTEGIYFHELYKVEHDFDGDCEAEYFDNRDDCIERIQEVLGLSPTEMVKILADHKDEDLSQINWSEIGKAKDLPDNYFGVHKFEAD